MRRPRRGVSGLDRWRIVERVDPFGLGSTGQAIEFPFFSNPVMDRPQHFSDTVLARSQGEVRANLGPAKAQQTNLPSRLFLRQRIRYVGFFTLLFQRRLTPVFGASEE